jgi:glycosyltransferase involved in cell wall biosynthesis
MSVYNGEKYLPQAIESILKQTYHHFEFIIINDGSTDLSRKIILSCKDKRIRLIDNQTNIGLTKSLNRGITEAKGELIARMDADDISLPKRFETQIEIFEKYDIDLCGTSMELIDEVGSVIGVMGPKTIVASDLPASVLNNSLWLPNGTFMVKRTSLNEIGGYDPDFRYAQDFDLCARMFLAGKKAIVIPEALVQWRQHCSQISQALREEQACYGYRVVKEYISSLLGDKATEHTSSLLNFFLITKPDLAKKQIPNFKLSDILSFREVFRQRFIHINNSLIGLDKRIANSAKYILKSSQSSLWMRIKMLYLYWLANLSVYHQEGSIVKGLSRETYKLLYGLAKRLFKVLVKRNNYRVR